MRKWPLQGRVMKMCLHLDAHRLDFLHRFYSANMVSGFRFQVSEKAEVFVSSKTKRQEDRSAN